MATEITKYSDAKALVDALDADRPTMVVSRRFGEGDHWQGGTQWGGPAIPTDMEGYGPTLVSLEKDQVPIPLIEEITDRHVTGVIGREMAFEVELNRELKEGQKLSAEEESDLAILNEALGAFYDNNDGQSVMYDYVTNYCSGRGVLRFLIPPDTIPDTGILTASDVRKAVDYFYFEAPSWEAAGVYVDKGSMKPYGIYLYAEDTGTKTVSKADVTFVDTDGQTVFRTFVDDVIEEDSERRDDCNGRIWIYQATTNKPLIGKPQIALQRKLNFLNFILPKNAAYAGFRARHTVNIERATDPDTGAPTDPTVGPSSIMQWQSTSYVDKDGNRRPGAGQLVIEEPVDSSPIRADIMHMKFQLLESCNQLHVLISGDATVSAVSRVQARGEFADSLLKTKPKVEKVMRDLLTTVICMACKTANDTGLLERFKKNYRVRVDVKPDAGPLTPEERRALIELAAAGQVSKETAMVLQGIEDVSGELNKLEREAENNLAVLMERATLAGQFILNGTEPQTAYEVAGFDKKTAKQLAKLPKQTDGLAPVMTDDEVVALLVEQGSDEATARRVVGAKVGVIGGEDE
jgi:hypothetical protein